MKGGSAVQPNRRVLDEAWKNQLQGEVKALTSGHLDLNLKIDQNTKMTADIKTMVDKFSPIVAELEGLASLFGAVRGVLRVLAIIGRFIRFMVKWAIRFLVVIGPVLLLMHIDLPVWLEKLIRAETIK